MFQMNSWPQCFDRRFTRRDGQLEQASLRDIKMNDIVLVQLALSRYHLKGPVDKASSATRGRSTQSFTGSRAWRGWRVQLRLESVSLVKDVSALTPQKKRVVDIDF